MHIIFNFKSSDHIRHIAKRLSKRFAIPYTQGLNWAARLFGYPSWKEMEDIQQWNPNSYRSDVSVPDSSCMPLVVKLRRDFHTKVLTELTGLPLDQAAAVIDDIRPTDRFTFSCPRIFHDINPRIVDPVIPVGTHRAIEVATLQLRRMTTHFFRPNNLAHEIKNRCERLYLYEYPIGQFPLDFFNPPLYRSTTYEHATPRWISDSQRGTLLQNIQIIRESFRPLSETDLSDEFDALCNSLDTLRAFVESWRAESAKHDGEKMRWLGQPPEDHAAIEYVRKHYPKPMPHDITFMFRALPSYITREAATHLLKWIEKMGEHERSLPEVRHLHRSAKASLTLWAKFADKERRRLEPMDRKWFIGLVHDEQIVPYAWTMAPNSLAALASTPVRPLRGRLIAVSQAQATLIPGWTGDVLESVKQIVRR